jgi:hypothetical protein
MLELIRDLKDQIEDIMNDLFDDYEVLESTTDREEQLLIIDRMIESIETIEESHKKIHTISLECSDTNQDILKSNMTYSSVLEACDDLKNTLLNKKGVI